MKYFFASLLIFAFTGCQPFSAQIRPAKESSPSILATQKKLKLTSNDRLIAAAIEQVDLTTEYDPAYVKINFPNGDVPIKTGVCADVIVRAFRKVDLDLQKELNEDMKRNFSRYPQKWGAKSPDSNIDHRRVPNLMTWFERQNKIVPISSEPRDFLPGDIVAWDLGKGLTHIGLVSDVKSSTADRFLIVHNIGSGAQLEDRIFDWKIIGHYRYFDPLKSESNSTSENSPNPIKIDSIKNRNLPDDCGCALWSLKDFNLKNIRARKNASFWSVIDDYAVMNLDGKEIKLKFVEASPRETSKVGARSWEKFQSDNYEARIDFVATKVCNPRDESCETTSYNATITVKRGGQASTLKTKGHCGC